MLTKLAKRNVQRQINNYIIYFITIAFTVALIFAINNVMYSKEILERASTNADLKNVLFGMTVIVSCIVAFVLSYATSFMLKLRKKEFGVYLTLGMTRRHILTIFILETLLMNIIALVVGIVFGLFLYQGLFALLCNLLEIQMSLVLYSMQGFILTCAIVFFIFILSSLTSSIYLSRVRISDLLHGDRKVEKGVKHPYLWIVLCILSAILFVLSGILSINSVEKAIFSFTGEMAGQLSLYIIAFSASIILLHISFSKCIIFFLIKNQKFSLKGTNIFTLRQLSKKLSANAIMSGILSFLLAFAIIGSNISFTQKISARESLNYMYPFDMYASFGNKEERVIDLLEAEKVVNQYTTIKNKIPYAFYNTGESTLNQKVLNKLDTPGVLNDVVICESDFNALYTALGFEPIQLNGSYQIVSNIPNTKGIDFSDIQLKLNGQEYTFHKEVENVPRFIFIYFYAIVPDEAVAGLTQVQSGMAYQFNDTNINGRLLHDDLSYEYNTGSYSIIRSNYNIREYGRMSINESTAIFIISALYLSVIFVCMAMAILGLKMLSTVTEDRQRYTAFYKIGATKEELKKSLFWQTFAYFFIPFIIPFLLSLPSGYICAKTMSMAGYTVSNHEVYINTTMIAITTLIIYVLYFFATYSIARKNSID